MSTDLKTVKIALLICGSLTGKAYALNGDYYDIYSKFIRDSTPEGTTFSLDPYDVVHKMDYPSEDDYDCIMLTGSGVCLILSLKDTCQLFSFGSHRENSGISVREHRVGEQTCWVHSSGSRNKATCQAYRCAENNDCGCILTLDQGICFGHQIIARALGGECVPNGGRWEVGPTTLQLSDLGKKIFGDVSTLVSRYRYL